MATPSTPLSQTCLQTAHSAMAAYNTWTVPAILAFRAPNCTHEILPASLGRQPMDNATYAAYMESVIPNFRGFELAVDDVIVDEVGKKVAMHASSKATTDLGDYANEYMIILYMTEDGSKVERFLEFVDSAYSKDFMGRLREAVARKGEHAGTSG